MLLSSYSSFTFVVEAMSRSHVSKCEQGIYACFFKDRTLSLERGSECANATWTLATAIQCSRSPILPFTSLQERIGKLECQERRRKAKEGKARSEARMGD